MIIGLIVSLIIFVIGIFSSMTFLTIGLIGLVIVGLAGRQYAIARKTMASLITAVLTVFLIIGMLALHGEEGAIYWAGLISLVVFPLMLLYGLPISLLSDFVIGTLEISKKKLLSLFVHFFFGVIFAFGALFIYTIFNFRYGIDTFFINLFFIPSLTGSFLFWLIDKALEIKSPIKKRV